jgi:4-hydroxy-tetrahydrodipicolinate reductase
MASREPATAVEYGVGPIGGRIVRAAVDHGFEFVGAVDIDPDKVGVDLGTVADVGRELGVTITDDADAALAAEPDVVFHSTVSSIETAQPQLAGIIEAGANVVSTTEELAYPWRRHPSIAEELDDLATEAGVSCLGAGINPGFVMDALPVFLSTPMDSVEAIHVERVQDAAQRRAPLQEKVGAGLDVDDFETEIAAHGGHVGSPESVAMIADAIGWELTDVTESIEPVVADRRVESDHVTVEPGDVAGIKQVATGRSGDRERITLDLRMYLGADSPHDAVQFEGRPDVEVTVEGGYHGDVATTAVIRNVAPRVRDARPGLLTMLDVQLPRYEAPP